MATNTTNLGLIKPAGTDKVRIAQINQNMDLIDAAIGPVGSTSLQSQVAAVDSGLAIVSNGNTHVAIASGQYVYIRNHSSLSEGLYKATAAIAANVALTTSNVTKVSTGGMNELKSAIDSVNSQKGSINSLASDTEILGYAPGTYMVALNANSEYIPTRYGTLVIQHASGNYGVAMFTSTTGNHYFRHMNGTNGWHTNWERVVLDDQLKFQIGDMFNTGGGNYPFRTLGDRSGIYFSIRLPKDCASNVNNITVEITGQSATWFSAGNIGGVQSGATVSNVTLNGRRTVAFSVPTANEIASTGFGVCSLNALITFTA